MVEPLFVQLFHSNSLQKAWPIRAFPSMPTSISNPVPSPFPTYVQVVIPNENAMLHEVLANDRLIAVMMASFRLQEADLSVEKLTLLTSVTIQGLELAWDTPIGWVHRHLLSVDGWINIVLNFKN
jgi:hypothetical protein